jgi:hypothetical protein
MNAEEDEHINLASKLLNSTDERVAAAAKRIFANAFTVESSFSESTMQKMPPKTNPQSSIANLIPSDVFDAASLLLAPKNTQKSSNVTGSRDLTPKVTEMEFNPQEPIQPKSLTSSSKQSVKKIQIDPNERLNRSRERNRMHARKTRQRKKEQMHSLEKVAEELKKNQVRLKLLIEEKSTANILVDLCTKTEDATARIDPRVEGLLKRKNDDIPDATKVPELPALILPGNHMRRSKDDNVQVTAAQEYPDDGIDYDLLAKDRSTCTQDELDKIRRERNRMHAKRTRDRKKIFIDRMEVMVSQLEEENNLLEEYLVLISSDTKDDDASMCSQRSKRALVSGETTPSFKESPKMGSLSIKAKAPDAPFLQLLQAASPSYCNYNNAKVQQKDRGYSITSSEFPDSETMSSTEARLLEEEEESPMKKIRIADVSTRQQ